MVGKSIREARCEDVLAAFCADNKPCVFFTLTTPDVVTIEQIRERWRNLRHYLMENVFSKSTKYVMNYELHPGGHGWHIHAVFNAFVPLKAYYTRIQSFGFGRMDVRRVRTKGVANYLSKHALKAYRGVSLRERASNPSFRLRLVNTSRGLPRLSDYAWRSDHKATCDRLSRSVMKSGDVTLTGIGFRRLYGLSEVAALCGITDSLRFRLFLRDPVSSAIRCAHALEYTRKGATVGDLEEVARDGVPLSPYVSPAVAALLSRSCEKLPHLCE